MTGQRESKSEKPNALELGRTDMSLASNFSHDPSLNGRVHITIIYVYVYERGVQPFNAGDPKYLPNISCDPLEINV